MFLSLDNCFRLAKAINKPGMLLVTVYSIWGKLSKVPQFKAKLSASMQNLSLFTLATRYVAGISLLAWL